MNPLEKIPRAAIGEAYPYVVHMSCLELTPFNLPRILTSILNYLTICIHVEKYFVHLPTLFTT